MWSLSSSEQTGRFIKAVIFIIINIGQYHDTVREELGEILDKIQEAYRKSHPDTVLLFATVKATSAIPDVEKATSALAPRQGTASLDYQANTYNLPDGNSQVGDLYTEARMGQIEVGYVDGAEPDRKFRFRMDVAKSCNRLFCA